MQTAEIVIPGLSWQMLKHAIDHALEQAEECDSESVREKFGAVMKMIQSIDESCKTTDSLKGV